jgi:hypothetical protein
MNTELVHCECPCCGEPIQLIIDCSIAEQEYVEDCQVCCRPLVVKALVDSDGLPDVSVQSEDL